MSCQDISPQRKLQKITLSITCRKQQLRTSISPQFQWLINWKKKNSWKNSLLRRMMKRENCRNLNIKVTILKKNCSITSVWPKLPTLPPILVIITPTHCSPIFMCLTMLQRFADLPKITKEKLPASGKTFCFPEL